MRRSAAAGDGREDDTTVSNVENKEVQALGTVSATCAADVYSLMHVQEENSKVEYNHIMCVRSMACMDKWEEDQAYEEIYMEGNSKLANSTYNDNYYYFACSRTSEQKLAREFNLFINYNICPIQVGDQKEVHVFRYYFGRLRPPEIHEIIRRRRSTDVLCLCATGWGPPNEKLTYGQEW